MSKVSKGLCVSAVAALLGLTTLTGTAAAAPSPAGGFADAKGIIVDLVVLTALPIPGPIAGTPIDPNTFSNASQSCPPNADKPAADSLLAVPAAPAATADAVDTMAAAKCSASDAQATAAAQTVGLKALFQGPVPVITADVIRAVANSDCTKAPNAAGTQIVGLTIAGQAIPANPPPNTTISIPGLATVIVNEQRPSADGRGIVVNGLHIIGTSALVSGNLIISHAVSGVSCPNGKGSDFSGVPGAKPIITFDKDASPSTAKAGDTITYTTMVTNKSTADCNVLRYIDHLDPAFDFVSTSGAFGAKPITPLPKRADGGLDVIIKPAPAVILKAGATVTQTYVVTLKSTVKPGTYYNNLEIFCAANGNFASGPLAPVTVPPPVVAPPPPAPRELPRTGGAPVLAGLAGLLLLAAAGTRRALR